MRVLVEEEYGYRWWWLQLPSDWNADNLKSWWENLPRAATLNFVFGDDKNIVPGTFTPVEEDAEVLLEWTGWKIHLHEEDDTFLTYVYGGPPSEWEEMEIFEDFLVPRELREWEEEDDRDY